MMRRNPSLCQMTSSSLRLGITTNSDPLVLSYCIQYNTILMISILSQFTTQGSG